MKKDSALVTSCREHDAAGTWRINLKWQGDHAISDFDLERMGQVVRFEGETEHSGYVIVKSSTNPNVGDTIHLRSK
jgi:hypothetical protein